MSTKTESLAIQLDEQRSRLERRGEVIRARLMRAIDALDKRRHHVEEIGHDAKRVAMPVAGALFGVVIITAGTTFAVRVLAQRRREQSFSYRLTSFAVARFRVEPKPSFWRQALRKVALSIIEIAATEFATRGVRLLGSRAPGDPVPPLGPEGGAV
jgi:hypothetical protein